MGQRLNLPADTPPVAHTSFSLRPPASCSISVSSNIPVTQLQANIQSKPQSISASMKRDPGHGNPDLWGPCHLLASQKGQLLPQTGDMVVASLPDGCAARNSLCAQVLHHAGLTGGLATWQPGPQGLRDHFGGAWARCLCSCPSSRQ